ncbi:MAG: sulfatase family protein [Planctomycetota bacterium]|jgi:arylsulfatase A-like enzyme
MNKNINILYLHSHDTGRYIQPYGYNVPTPNLQKLAEESVLFRQAFCVGPTCSPSRAGLLTGMYPHCCGMMGLSHRGHSLNDYKQHIVTTLKNAGYTAALSGTQHIYGPHHEKPDDYGSAIGYDRILNFDDRYDRWGHRMIAERAVEFLEEEHEQPFFLSVGFVETHREFPDVDDEEAKYTMPPAIFPDTPEIRKDFTAYQKSAHDLDRQMGMVLAALEKSGKAENTLVICTTDHGIAFPEMKCRLTDHGTGVMLMIRGPEGFGSGKVIDAMVTHLDIFPTICEVTGIEKPDWLQGKSLLPLVKAEAEDLHNEVFAEINHHADYQPMRSVRTKRWKYIKRFEETENSLNCDTGITKEYLLKSGWNDKCWQEEELYDLIFDPLERNNFSKNAKYSEIKSKMAEKLSKWMKNTSDPLFE